MRLAIYGGTFDPVHKAHLAVAHRAVERFQLDRVLLVPAFHPPHKSGGTHAPYSDRLRMAELACRGQDRLEVSRLEEGTEQSYSIDTIEKVRAGLAPADELYFLIGADAFAEIRTWRRWRDVAAAVQFLVVSRPGMVYDPPPETRLLRLDTLEMPVSSSAIRKALAAGQSPEEVPTAVLDYIREQGLYGTGARP